VPNLIPRLKERAEERCCTRRSLAASRNHTSGSVNSLEIGSEVLLGPIEGHSEGQAAGTKKNDQTEH
jgi:hypothetical protein